MLYEHKKSDQFYQTGINQIDAICETSTNHWHIWYLSILSVIRMVQFLFWVEM